MKATYVFLSVLTIVCFSKPTMGAGEADTLEEYWPLRMESGRWSLIDLREKYAPGAVTLLTVEPRIYASDQLDLWFSNKAGQDPSESDVERYTYCGLPGGMSWLFLTEYMKAKDGRVILRHPVRATRILFTPDSGETRDLIADGTYARCGGTGQPYLAWNLVRGKYRIQVWGVLVENPRWKWYWDASVFGPTSITNDCLLPAQTVQAIRVQEAWWNNFSNFEGRWNLGFGEIGPDGLPTGNEAGYGRTVWHAKGRMPYFMTGGADGSSASWCTNNQRGFNPQEYKARQ